MEGKRDRDGAPLLSDIASLSTADIALALVGRLPDGPHRAKADQYFTKVTGAQQAVAGMNQINTRKPHFCSGCPHNTSTTLPEGSRALAGIGCHYMATFTPERRTDMHTQMGGEGTPWIGQIALHRREACVREPGRWHVFALGLAGDPRGDLGQGECDLQDPLQ